MAKIKCIILKLLDLFVNKRKFVDTSLYTHFKISKAAAVSNILRHLTSAYLYSPFDRESTHSWFRLEANDVINQGF